MLNNICLSHYEFVYVVELMLFTSMQLANINFRDTSIMASPNIEGLLISNRISWSVNVPQNGKYRFLLCHGGKVIRVNRYFVFKKTCNVEIISISKV